MTMIRNDKCRANNQKSTVRLLESGTSSPSSEFLRLAATRVGNKKSSVVTNKQVLDLFLGLLINVLLVIGNQGLSNTLPNSVNL
ncbi:hypothetical protein Mapa_008772 [Marchantia paleacea]|nr:hypothetical protein Mapa_008772 [Marchantia paleacea]